MARTRSGLTTTDGIVYRDEPNAAVSAVAAPTDPAVAVSVATHLLPTPDSPRKLDAVDALLRRLCAVAVRDTADAWQLDLTRVLSHPDLCVELVTHLYHLMRTDPVQYHYVCGVPIAALPLASLVCGLYARPLLIARKRWKGGGWQRCVDGDYVTPATATVMETTVTTGTEVAETIATLNYVGIRVTRVVAVVGSIVPPTFANTDGTTVVYQSLFTSTDVERVWTRTPPVVPRPRVLAPTCLLTAAHRTRLQVVRTFIQHKSCLVAAVHATTTRELCDAVDAVGDYVCAVQTHVEMITDWGDAGIRYLQHAKRKRRFLVWEDRVIADKHTGVLRARLHQGDRVSEWADMVSCALVDGRVVIPPDAPTQVPRPTPMLMIRMDASQLSHHAVVAAAKVHPLVVGMYSDGRRLDAATCYPFMTSEPWTVGNALVTHGRTMRVVHGTTMVLRAAEV